MRNTITFASAVFVFSLTATPLASAADDGDLITSAEAAAPTAVSSKAAIYAMGADGKMRTLREGSNGFWCMPDDPTTPGPDPMCGDANSMEWAMAWMGHKDPPKGKTGLIYMLMGGPAASNLDPFATTPAEGSDWIMDRPHLMIVNFGESMAGYPNMQDKPDTTQPYVMWGGTPYAHLMVPVQ